MANGPLFDPRPTHIVDQRSDDRTHCGIRLKDKAALPYVGRRFVQAHIDGRMRAQRPPIVFCPQCQETEE